MEKIPIILGPLLERIDFPPSRIPQSTLVGFTFSKIYAIKFFRHSVCKVVVVDDTVNSRGVPHLSLSPSNRIPLEDLPDARLAVAASGAGEALATRRFYEVTW